MLNQALALVLLDMDDDIILIAEADSAIAPKFLAIAAAEMAKPETARHGVPGALRRGVHIQQMQSVMPAAFARGNEQEKDLS